MLHHSNLKKNHDDDTEQPEREKDSEVSEGLAVPFKGSVILFPPNSLFQIIIIIYNFLFYEASRPRIIGKLIYFSYLGRRL